MPKPGRGHRHHGRQVEQRSARQIIVGRQIAPYKVRVLTVLHSLCSLGIKAVKVCYKQRYTRVRRELWITSGNIALLFVLHHGHDR